MGNMCANPPQDKDVNKTPDLIPGNVKRVASDIKTNTETTNVTELWRDLPLEQELLVKSVHPHKLTKTISNV